jgi:Fasciclin domain
MVDASATPCPTIDGAGVIATDVPASNGIIHAVNGVLLPVAPPRSPLPPAARPIARSAGPLHVRRRGMDGMAGTVLVEAGDER